MKSVTNLPKGRVVLYACGGCGVNIGQKFEQHRNSSEVGMASIDIVYIDTSSSNIHNGINSENSYMIEGMDGSGKVRKENHEEISLRIRAIMQQFKPGDLNIVLSSAAGGSGSVIAPLLTSELLANEYPTIVISIGSADTRLDCDNSLKTIKSYESIAKMRKAPVVMRYIQNGITNSRANTDIKVYELIVNLCTLFSRENKELDTRDLFNFLRFDRVTTFPSQLVFLDYVEGLDGVNDISKIGNIISVATIANENTETVFPDIPEYQCVGYFNNSIAPSIANKSPMHFITCDGVFSEVTKGLNDVLRTLEQTQNARVRKASILSQSDSAEDTGLIL